MNLTTILTSPGFVLLLKWTSLLALAWGAHGLLRQRDARWRLILWRSVLCFGLLLPMSQFLALPGVKIPVGASMVDTGNAAKKAVTLLQNPKSRGSLTFQPEPAVRVVSWKAVLATIWLLGCVLGMVRLTWLQLALIRLRNQATQPTAEITQLAEQVRTALKLRRVIPIRTASAIASPFVCNLLKPTVMLPRTLVQSLTPAELRAVLNHEMAHIRQNDLVWCVAWQWLRAVCWFHPLVWLVPAAHNLACEQEADRMASAQMPGRDSYIQLLARLALKVLALPTVETHLTVNGSSQIAKRLIWLSQSRVARWNWRFSVSAFSVSLMLFLAVAGCETTKKSPISDQQRVRNVIAALVQEKVVPDAATLDWFGLSDTELIVNGEKQPDALQQKLKALVSVGPGNGLYFGPVQMTGQGVFIEKKEL
jgi:beta-lactamase regulating signal transducer with metallopeptidase domain